MIDILEQALADLSKDVLDCLLFDRTTRKNICWGTDHYEHLGAGYKPDEPILPELITGENTWVIQPRVSKDVETQLKRTKDNAEVFTPSWICNEQNNLVDSAWFGRKITFNTVDGETWKAVEGKIRFPKRRKWQTYVDKKRLEITCGEAPYLVSRYDTVTGMEIPIPERIGLLDRKLRIVNENAASEEEWFKWTQRAFESIYGYDYQGDNVLLARENLLHTFIEYTQNQFSHEPSLKQIKTIAKIISWNIWQMDGITMNAPYALRPKKVQQVSLFGDVEEIEMEPVPCRIYDWRDNNSLEFRSMIQGGR